MIFLCSTVVVFFLFLELDEEAQALQALLSSISKPTVSSHFCISSHHFSNEDNLHELI